MVGQGEDPTIKDTHNECTTPTRETALVPCKEKIIQSNDFVLQKTTQKGVPHVRHDFFSVRDERFLSVLHLQHDFLLRTIVFPFSFSCPQRGNNKNNFVLSRGVSLIMPHRKRCYFHMSV